MEKCHFEAVVMHPTNRQVILSIGVLGKEVKRGLNFMEVTITYLVSFIFADFLFSSVSPLISDAICYCLSSLALYCWCCYTLHATLRWRSCHHSQPHHHQHSIITDHILTQICYCFIFFILVCVVCMFACNVYTCMHVCCRVAHPESMQDCIDAPGSLYSAEGTYL